MAHFAELDLDNVVKRVIVVSNDVLKDSQGEEKENLGILYCQQLLGGIWKQTSYNSSFRKNYAGVGFLYDASRDAFIAPKPYPSWVLIETTCQWESPVPYPSDGRQYRWDEATISWIEV